MPPRDSKPANSRRKPKLDVQEPALTNMLEKYCDLRRRGFGQKAIQTKANWPRHYPSLLLEEAQRREMTGSQGSQKQAVTEWLLAIAAGTGDVLMARLRKGRHHRVWVPTSRRPHPHLLEPGLAWPVRPPLPINPGVNASDHRFGGFGVRRPDDNRLRRR